MPMISCVVFRSGRIITSIKSSKTFTELSMLVSDLLLSHVSLGGSSGSGAPREEIVKCILKLQSKYPKLHRAVGEGLQSFAIEFGESQHDDNDDEEEDEEDNVEHIETLTNVEKRRDESNVIFQFLEGLLDSEE
ncbi:hypothetical protein HK096_003407, partial [Nowakowskiella sp. JEL0078]